MKLIELKIQVEHSGNTCFFDKIMLFLHSQSIMIEINIFNPTVVKL
jgi:hypothetical protein